jgi:hypothetical protein
MRWFIRTRAMAYKDAFMRIEMQIRVQMSHTHDLYAEKIRI